VTEEAIKDTFESPALGPGMYQLYIVFDSQWPYRYVTSSDVFTVAESCEVDINDDDDDNYLLRRY
jgi:hypothetical protein